MFQRTRDYAKDYEKIGSTLHYKGKHYRFEIEQPALNIRKVVYALGLVAALVFYILIGFSDSAALGAGGGPAPAYVLLPYVLLLLPLGLGVARALLLVFKSRPLEYAEYDKYLAQQKGVLVSALVVAGILLLGMIIFLFIRQADQTAQMVALGEAALCAACIFLAFRQYHALLGSIAIDEPSSVRYDI
ncbi:MAG: hypothetical protein ABFC56_13160 [Clostridiaceae bacterium]